jgi:hypothetical protein
MKWIKPGSPAEAACLIGVVIFFLWVFWRLIRAG